MQILQRGDFRSLLEHGANARAAALPAASVVIQGML